MTLFAENADDERVTSRRISMTDLKKKGTVRKTEHYLLLIILMTIPYEI